MESKNKIEIVKAKPNIRTFLSKSDRKFITDKGEYTNGRWLIKTEYTPQSVKDVIDKDKEGIQPCSRALWDNIPKEKLEKCNEIIGYSIHNEKIYYVLQCNVNRKIALLKSYYDFLMHHIKECSFWAVSPGNENRPLVFFSGNEMAGLVMPLYEIKDNEFVCFETITQENKNNDINNIPKQEEKCE